MIVTTPARRIIASNAAASVVFGYAPAEFAGLPARDLYGPEEDFVRVRNAFTGASCTPSTASLRHKSGMLFDADVTAACILDDQGQVCSVVETFRIATTARAPADAPPALQCNSAAVRLARGVAHDFNNLLAIITGNVQLAGRKTTDAARSSYLREAEQACDMAARLTQRLMTFAEDRHYAASQIAPGDVLTAQHPLLKYALGDAAALAFDITGDAWPILADRSALENAILNLIINARDAMVARGTVTVSVRNERRASEDHHSDAHAGGLNAGDYVRIAVSDTGTGMPPGIVARAFDPFFTTKPLGRGTGLGLASVYGFAKQSGGTAMIESAPGRGTTVTLILPATSPALSGKRSKRS